MVLRTPFCSLACSGLSFKVFLVTPGIYSVAGSRCHPLVPLPSSTEFYPQRTRPRTYRDGQTALQLILSTSPGVLVPTAFYRTRSPYNPGLPHPALAALRVSTLAAVFVSLILPGLFHPGTLLGFSLQSLPFQKSRRASRRPVPSCRYRFASSAENAARLPRPVKVTSSHPTTGFCSLLESVLPGLGVSQCLGPVLSWASPSSGFSSSSVAPRISTLLLSCGYFFSLPLCSSVYHFFFAALTAKRNRILP